MLWLLLHVRTVHVCKEPYHQTFASAAWSFRKMLLSHTDNLCSCEAYGMRPTFRETQHPVASVCMCAWMTDPSVWPCHVHPTPLPLQVRAGGSRHRGVRHPSVPVPGPRGPHVQDVRAGIHRPRVHDVAAQGESCRGGGWVQRVRAEDLLGSTTCSCLCC